jgi:hypothetical protein
MEGVNSSMIYWICCKNFCNSHNVPTPSTTIKNRKNGNNSYILSDHNGKKKLLKSTVRETTENIQTERD